MAQKPLFRTGVVKPLGKKKAANRHGKTPTLLAIWANTAPATLHLQDHAAVSLQPGTLAWSTLDAAQTLAVHSDDALFMEIGL